VRMASGRATVPNLYSGCLNKRSCDCLFVQESAFAMDLRFCGLILGTARRSEKEDRETAFLFVLLHAVPKIHFFNFLKRKVWFQ
jgi:hypothetical protein